MRLRDVISRFRRRPVDLERLAARSEAAARQRNVRNDMDVKYGTGSSGVWGPQVGGGGF